jgi:hypothetical protein
MKNWEGIMFNEKFKTTMSVLAFAACLLFGGQAQAIMLGFSPSTQNVNIGDSVDVDLVISGLGEGAAPSLSVFDLDVLYDSTILGLANVAFGDPVYGDQLDVFGFGLNPTGVGAVAGGTNLFELSLDFPFDLDLFQRGNFTLARLTFNALAEGTSALDLANVLLGDANGDPLTADVTAGRVAVPEPSTVVLMSFGLVGLGFARRR